MVVLSLTKLEYITYTIEIDVAVEVSTLASTLNLSSSLRAVVCFSDIIRRIVIHVRITVRIDASTEVINLVLIERRQSIAGTSLIIQGHVLS